MDADPPRMGDASHASLAILADVAEAIETPAAPITLRPFVRPAPPPKAVDPPEANSGPLPDMTGPEANQSERAMNWDAWAAAGAGRGNDAEATLSAAEHDPVAEGPSRGEHSPTDAEAAGWPEDGPGNTSPVNGSDDIAMAPPGADGTKRSEPGSAAGGAPGRGPSGAVRTWWSVAKSELHNLKQLLQRMGGDPEEIPPGMYLAVNLPEDHCRTMDIQTLRRLVEKRISVVAGRLAESHPCASQGLPCPFPATCAFRDVPVYTCRRWMEGSCTRNAAECSFEHLNAQAVYRPAQLRVQYSLPRKADEPPPPPVRHRQRSRPAPPPPPSRGFFIPEDPPVAVGLGKGLGMPGLPGMGRPRGAYTAVTAPGVGLLDTGFGTGPYGLEPPMPRGPGALPTPQGLTCSPEKWQVNYAKFLEDLKLDLLDCILHHGGP